jgi:hypothetical protein
MSDKKWEEPSLEIGQGGQGPELNNGCRTGSGTGHGCGEGCDHKTTASQSFVPPELNLQVAAVPGNTCDAGGGVTNGCNYGGGNKNDCKSGSD